MKNLLFRLLLVSIALPSLIGAALFAPFFNHVILALVIIAFGIGSLLELLSILKQGNVTARCKLLAALIILIPSIAIHIVGTLSDLNVLELAGLALLYMPVVAGIVAVPLVLTKATLTLRDSLARTIEFLFAVSYIYFPTMLLLLLLSGESNQGFIVLWFCLIAFSNDSAAWLIGMTLGRHRGLVSVSPNKSVEGFLAGLIGSVAAAFLGNYLFKLTDSTFLILGMGISCGFSGILGDLFESAIKRSYGVKDSGTSIPGRGGFLDSYDSLMFSSLPFFIILVLMGLL